MIKKLKKSKLKLLLVGLFVSLISVVTCFNVGFAKADTGNDFTFRNGGSYSVNDKGFYNFSGISGWGFGAAYNTPVSFDGLKLRFKIPQPSDAIYGISLVKNLTDYGPEINTSLDIVFTSNNSNYTDLSFLRTHDVNNELSERIAYVYNEDGSKNPHIGGIIDGSAYPNFKIEDNLYHFDVDEMVNYPTLDSYIDLDFAYCDKYQNYVVGISIYSDFPETDTDKYNYSFLENDKGSEYSKYFYIDRDVIESTFTNGKCYLSYFNLGTTGLSSPVFGFKVLESDKILPNTVEWYENRITDLESELNFWSSQINYLTTTTQSLREQVSLLNEELTLKENERSSLEMKVNSLNSTIQKQNESIAGLQRIINTYGGEIDIANKYVELEKDFNDLVFLNQKLDEENKELNSKLALYENSNVEEKPVIETNNNDIVIISVVSGFVLIGILSAIILYHKKRG